MNDSPEQIETTELDDVSGHAMAKEPARLPEAEPMAIQDIRDALVIRERDMFLLTLPSGEAPAGNANGLGLYHADTRYLSAYEFSFSATRPMVLLSTAELGFSSEHVLTNFLMPDANGTEVPANSIGVHRTRVLEDVLEETVSVTNYNTFPVVLELVFRLAADFADIFSIRGFEDHEIAPSGHIHWHDGSVRLHNDGAGGRNRETKVLFSPHPDETAKRHGHAVAIFRPALAPRESALIRLVVTVDGRLESPQEADRFAVVEREYTTWLSETTHIRTDNELFDAVLARSVQDLRMLWNHDESHGGYPAAGTPWYDTLFGRDTAIVGLQTLWVKPEIARECLRALATHQGTKFDSWRDEEPGKILHELRVGDLTAAGQLPFSPYYGSIDSTPLFLMLAAEYFRWTGDIDLISELEPNIRMALHWVERYGDINPDCYVEYEKRSPKGLVNQSWKDSGDSMQHADGTLLEPPIAPVEVQGYVFAAYAGLAPVFEALGDSQMAKSLRVKAKQLRDSFNNDFWCDGGWFALALDGKGHKAEPVTSNPGHAMWTGIASPEHAGIQASRLFEPDMFSGWGLRTLSSGAPRYNPQGYHNGTVWPHDNSIAAMGLKRYGFEAEVNRLGTVMFEAARAFPYYRLPELFGGNPRSAHKSPVPYPVACRPQAWAAGAIPLITQAILGLHPDATNHRLYVVRPTLPEWLGVITVSGLSVAGAQVSLRYQRTGDETRVEVLKTTGDLAVSVIDTWPDPLNAP